MSKKKKLGTADKIDKYRLHLLDNAPLDAEQTAMLTKYRRANALMCSGYSRMQTMTILSKESDIGLTQAYNILRDSIELFGDMGRADKDGMRFIMYENFMLASQLAKKKEDIGAMIRALENASRIYDLFTLTEEGIDASKYVKPAEIIFSTDPQVLIDQQAEETEDTDYEEAEDEEGN